MYGLEVTQCGLPQLLSAVEALWQVLAILSHFEKGYRYLQVIQVASETAWFNHNYCQRWRAASEYLLECCDSKESRFQLVYCFPSALCTKETLPKIFWRALWHKETRFTLHLPVQSPFYRGNSAKFFGEYLWLDSNYQRFEIWLIWLVF